MYNTLYIALRHLGFFGGFSSPALSLTIDTQAVDPENVDFNLRLGGRINATINWGDGTSEVVDVDLGSEGTNPLGVPNYGTDRFYHEYETPGVYTVTVTGRVDQLGSGPTTESVQRTIVSVNSFGRLGTVVMNGFLSGTTNLASVPTAIPTTVVSLEGMFAYSTYNGTEVSSWNTGNVQNFFRMFYENQDFNQNIGAWDMREAVVTQSMFHGATSFNNGGSPSINTWQLNKLRFLEAMFRSAENFNQPIGGWNVSLVESFDSMFRSATAFNQPIGGWNVSSAVSMYRMFRGAEQFNQPLNTWDVSNVTNFEAMFRFAESFDQPLDNWVVSSATNMHEMFQGAIAFNQNISDWNTANVENFSYMFQGAIAFDNGGDFNIRAWNVSSGTSFDYMFELASNFNQPIGNWNFGPIDGTTRTYDGFLSGSGYTASTYNAFLTALAIGPPLQVDTVIGVDGLQYTEAAEGARTAIINLYNWTFFGDSLAA